VRKKPQRKIQKNTEKYRKIQKNTEKYGKYTNKKRQPSLFIGIKHGQYTVLNGSQF